MKRRRMFATALAVLLLMTVSAAASTNGHTREEAVRWAYGHIGTDINYDGYSGPDGSWPTQCVDLTVGYYRYLGHRVGGDAKEYATNGLPDGWQRVYSNPQPGDVAVRTAGTYGHVGIVVTVSGDACSTVEYNTYGGTYDASTQTWSIRYPGQEITRSNSYWDCFNRPDFPPPEPTLEPTPQSLPGDADADGEVGLLDLLAIIDNIVSDAPVASLANADMNGSGDLDLMDLLAIIDAIVRG